MIPYKDRQLDETKPVYVYRNLRGDAEHKYSVRQNGLVVAHIDKVLLVDVTFVVNPKGQQRVRATKRKNVHAFIKGVISDSGMGTNSSGKLAGKITYNPYTDSGFMCYNLVSKPFKVNGAMCVIINSFGVTASYINS